MNRAVIIACLLVAVMAMQPLNAVRVLDEAPGRQQYSPPVSRAKRRCSELQCIAWHFDSTGRMMLHYALNCAGASRTLLQDSNATASPSPALAGEAASVMVDVQCRQNAYMGLLAFIQVLIRGLNACEWSAFIQ